MRIIGIDPGTAITGFGVIDTDDFLLFVYLAHQALDNNVKGVNWFVFLNDDGLVFKKCDINGLLERRSLFGVEKFKRSKTKIKAFHAVLSSE